MLLSETIVELVQTNAKLRKKFVQFQTFMNETITSTTSKQSFSSCIEATNSNKDLDYYLIDIGSKKSIPVKCKTSNGIGKFSLLKNKFLYLMKHIKINFLLFCVFKK